MDRREFLKEAGATAAMLSCFPATLSGIDRQSEAGLMERRALGATGQKLSIIGFGGIVVMNATPQQAAERVSEAIDRGVNYFDVAPTYGDAQQKLGPALKPYRKDVFLACKTAQRHGAEATAELEQSLKVLQTDHLDLYQLHAVTTQEDVDAIFAPGGAMAAFVQAKKAGKVRFLGFSAHSVEAAMALMDSFGFDTILFPFSFTTWHAGNFGPQVLALAREKKMGILALKAMARGPWPEGAERRYPKCWYEPLSDPAEAKLGLRFALSHPITAALPPGDENLFRMAMDVVEPFAPLTESEALEIKKKALAGTPLFRYPQG